MLGFSSVHLTVSLLSIFTSLFFGSMVAASTFSLSVGSGKCIILAQLTMGGVETLQAMHPICGGSSTSQQQVPFPLTSAGDGAGSQYLLYAQLDTVAGYGGNTAKAGCVMELYTNEIDTWLLGHSWEWDDGAAQIRHAGTGAVLAGMDCEKGDVTMNPSYLFLPNPHQLPDDAGQFYEVIPIERPSSKRDVLANTTEVVSREKRNRLRP